MPTSADRDSTGVAATILATCATLALPAAASAGAVRTEHITDPTLGDVVAFDIRVPAKWHFQGTLGQGGQCVGVPFQVFEAIKRKEANRYLLPRDRRFNMSFTLAGVGSFSNFLGAFGGSTY